MRKTIMVAGIALGSASVAAMPSDARADATADAYADVRSIIEDVITVDVAKGLADQLQARNPVLRAYLSGFIEKLRTRQWATLRDGLRDDLDEIAGDYVFFAIDHCADALDAQACTREFLDPGKRCTAYPVSGSSASCAAGDAAAFSAHLVTSKCRDGDPTKATDAAGLRTLVACDAALTIEDSIQGHRPEVRGHLIDTIADVLVVDLVRATVLAPPDAPALRDKVRTVLNRWLTDPKALETELAALSDELRTASYDEQAYRSLLRACEVDTGNDAVKRLCGLVEGLRKAARSVPQLQLVQRAPGATEDATVNVALGGAVLEPVRSALDAKTDASAPSRATRAISALLANVPASCPSKVWPSCGGTIADGTKLEMRKPGGSLKLVYKEGAWTADVPEPTVGGVQKKTARNPTDATDASVEKMIREFLPVAAPEEQAAITQANLAARAIWAMVYVSDALRTRWYAWDWGAGARSPDATFLRLGEVLTSSFAFVSGEECQFGDKAKPVYVAKAGAGDDAKTAGAFLCKLLSTFRTSGSGTGTLLDSIQRAASKGDYGRLASGMVATILENTRSPVMKPEDLAKLSTDAREAELAEGARKDAVFNRFFVTAASYVVDIGSEGSQREASRAAFRDAARDALIELGDGRGVPDIDHGWRKRWQESWIPDLGIAESWSATYRNATPRDGLRYTATANWLVLRWAASHNFGLRGSLVDLFGPFSELALRPSDAHPENPGLLLLDAVRPRLGVWGAVPEVTRNVTVEANVGWRPLAICGDRIPGGGVAGYDYAFTPPWTSSCKGAGGKVPVGDTPLELSVGATVVF